MGSRIRNDRLSDAAGSGAALSGSQKPLSAGLQGLAGRCRSGSRFLILAASLVEFALHFLLLRLRYGSQIDLPRRAAWLHRCCRVLLPRLGLRLESRGPIPRQGLIVSNHLSYLDIVVYAAIAPCVFVSKREVSRWPAFGLLARCGGTIFVDRRSRSDTDEAARCIGEALGTGVPVLLFPEGTSSDGREVLRFHPSLLEPAIRAGAPVAAAAIGYSAPGACESDLCYYGDIHFVPHLLATLGRRGVAVEVEFYPAGETAADRKAAALDLHDKVAALRRLMRRAPKVSIAQ